MNKGSAFDLSRFMGECQTRIQCVLEAQLMALPPYAEKLRRAMHYASAQGGKRVRPQLVYASAQALGAPMEVADIPACAIELLHCYSLIHDDLPAMDNDALRRGQPTVHIAFGEATAILAGDALQAMAFRLLSTPALLQVNDSIRLQMINTLAAAGGFEGMVSGQAIDFESVGHTLSLEQLQHMHNLKTGALISASVLLGAQASGCAQPDQLHALNQYSRSVGLAFQVQDDILDVIANTATLGKPQGADQALNKPTYVSLLGLEGARDKAQELLQEALRSVEAFDQRADALRHIARFVIERPS